MYINNIKENTIDGKKKEQERGDKCTRAVCWVIELLIEEGRRRRVGGHKWEKELEERGEKRQTREGESKIMR